MRGSTQPMTITGTEGQDAEWLVELLQRRSKTGPEISASTGLVDWVLLGDFYLRADDIVAIRQFK